jgi:tetratricopeptide (TPR) repeat protein
MKSEWVSYDRSADSLRAQRKWKEALDAYENQVRPLVVALYTEQSDEYEGYLYRAADCHMHLKQFSEARKLADQRCELTKNLHGEESTQYGSALRQIGSILRQHQGDNAAALKYYEQAKLLLPKDHPDYVSVVNGMAMALMHLEQFDLALSLILELVEIVRWRHGDQHIEYATALNNSSIIYANLARFDLAIEHEKKVLEIRELNLGPDHPKTISASKNLADYQTALKDNTFAQLHASNKRMCSLPSCGKITNKEEVCDAYCSAECRDKDSKRA